MPQLLLFPDPRPLVERLGREFFRQAPERAGVYLMRDSADTVLYVGKAKNLRKRLTSYRVANPERMARRHLRLLRAVARIELQECADESSALARESELLRSLRPRFNRAGTWPGPPRFLGWRVTAEGLNLAVEPTTQPDWHGHGPLGAGAFALRDLLVRLIWCAVHPARGLAGMPAGWFIGKFGDKGSPQARATRRKEQSFSSLLAPSGGGGAIARPGVVRTIPHNGASPEDLQAAAGHLDKLFAGCTEDFCDWVRERTSGLKPAFEVAARDADLEAVLEFGLLRSGSAALGISWFP